MQCYLLICIILFRERRVQRLQQCRLTAKYIDESLQKWRDEVDMHTRCTMQRAQQVLQVKLLLEFVYNGLVGIFE